MFKRLSVLNLLLLLPVFGCQARVFNGQQSQVANMPPPPSLGNSPASPAYPQPGAQVITKWVVAVRPGSPIESCASWVKGEGFKVTGILRQIGVFMVTTHNANESVRFKSVLGSRVGGCIVGFEPENDVTVGSPRPNRGAPSAQVVTHWVATVRSGQNIDVCAQNLRQNGVEVTKVLREIGVVTITTRNEVSRVTFLQMISSGQSALCFLTVEPEGNMGVL